MTGYHSKKWFFRITERIGLKNPTDHSLDAKTDVLFNLKLLLLPEEVIKFVNAKNSLSIVEPNYLIDLSIEEDEILKRIHKNTRYKINRASKRDELRYVELTSPTDKQIESFRVFFNPFARKKNINECDVNKLKALRDQDALVISYIEDNRNKILCCHVYFVDHTQGYLIYSCSRRFEKDGIEYRNLIGRANRYLHWRDILSFKQKGCKWYNFGGKIMNREDKEGQNVNHFKASFGTKGGYDLRIYYAQNLMGKLFLFLLRLNFIWKRTPEYAFALKFMHKQKRLQASSNVE